MAEAIRYVVLKGEMTEAKAAFAIVWPRVSIFLYRPTTQHYKEGYPTEEELEFQPFERHSISLDREAILHGNHRLQQVQSTIMSTFSLETALHDHAIHALWNANLDELNTMLMQ